MNRASSFIGKPIFTPSGQQVDTIDDVIFDPHTHYVLCFMVEPGGWVGGAKILPWSDDCAVTPHALTISSQEQIVFARKVPRIQEILEDIQVVVGKKIVAPDGRQLGILDDVYFDQKTGEIGGYEVIGLAQRTDFESKAILGPEEVDFVKGDNAVLLVSPATTDLIEQRIHGE